MAESLTVLVHLAFVITEKTTYPDLFLTCVNVKIMDEMFFYLILEGPVNATF